jgi:probable HAF family extracellular repeat protein
MMRTPLLMDVAFGLALLAALFMGSSALAASYVYNLIDLTPGVTADCHPTGVNDSGQAVGNYYGNPSGFLSSEATGFVDLGSVLGSANGINTSGQIVGVAGGHAALYNSGTITDLGVLGSGGSNSVANAINDAGQIVGQADINNAPESEAFLYSGGSMQSLGVLYGRHGNSWATAINSNGVIVGASQPGDTFSGTYWNNHAFVYRNGTMTDLGVLPGSPANSSSGAAAVNNAGVTVGSAETNGMWGVQHAVLWDANGTIHDLGIFPDAYDGSNANGINDSGQVVGWAYGSDGQQHGFIRNSTDLIDLNTLIDTSSGWTVYSAVAIKNNGLIVAEAGNPDADPDQFGWGHTVLLVPLSGDANLDGVVNINDLSKVLANYDKSGMTWFDGDLDGNGAVDINDLSKVLASYDKSYGASAGLKAVPEPGTVALLLAGLAAIAVWARRKRV